MWTFLSLCAILWQLNRILAPRDVRTINASADIANARVSAMLTPMYQIVAFVFVVVVLVGVIVAIIVASAAVTVRHVVVPLSEANVHVVPQAPQVVSLPMPTSTPMSLPPGQPSLSSLTIGYDDDNVPVRVSLDDMMHTLCVGSSGYGKSTWVRALLHQIALTHDPISVVAVDCFGSEFNCMRDWNKLLVPVARTHSEAAMALQTIRSEIVRRQSMFEQYPLASKLSEYNRLTSDEMLCPILCVVDEGTAMLNEADVGDILRSMVQTARQYGVYVTLLGQSVNYKVMETQTRDQFSSRVCFRVPPSSSKIVLDDRCAGFIDTVGVAYAQLSGKPLFRMRSPFVSREQFYEALTGGGPSTAFCDTVTINHTDDTERIRQMYLDGLNCSAIASKVYGSAGGSGWYKVKDVVDSLDSSSSTA